MSCSGPILMKSFGKQRISIQHRWLPLQGMVIISIVVLGAIALATATNLGKMQSITTLVRSACHAVLNVPLDSCLDGTRRAPACNHASLRMGQTELAQLFDQICLLHRFGILARFKS